MVSRKEPPTTATSSVSASIPSFCSTSLGDCEGATLRPGNVLSADGWQELLEPVVKGYQKKGLRLLFRGDAAFAKPELYEYLEQGADNSRKATETSGTLCDGYRSSPDVSILQEHYRLGAYR